MEGNDVNAKPEKPFTLQIGSLEIELTPVKEYLGVFVVYINTLITICGATLAPIVMVCLLFTRLWFAVLVYVAWIYYDRRTGFEGGRKMNWFRRLHMFKIYRDYFPTKLIKTVDLPADKNYLLIMYPHGVLPYSVLANFATEANNIESEVFPGLDIRFITLDINFLSPITREYFLALGACGSKESSIQYLLRDKSTPKGVVLLPGGASESAFARAGSTYSIIISRRRGFVRIALATGTALVPVFSFGENNVYNDQVENKWVVWIQNLVCKYAGFRPIVPKGRGIFQKTYGLLPRSTKINTVVGKPIEVPKVENPSKELIDEYHEKFVNALKSLFEEYKEQYDEAGSKAKLVLI